VLSAPREPPGGGNFRPKWAEPPGGHVGVRRPGAPGGPARGRSRPVPGGTARRRAASRWGEPPCPCRRAEDEETGLFHGPVEVDGRCRVSLHTMPRLLDRTRGGEAGRSPEENRPGRRPRYRRQENREASAVVASPDVGPLPGPAKPAAVPLRAASRRAPGWFGCQGSSGGGSFEPPGAGGSYPAGRAV
jgi:hypothetical protein